ncbi:HPr family phosphocarrier protein [Natronorarus salvus]|uniref:HPr family phosphocarrier protein n=1 Tax=Natronorarus salvus TaxID=3117733 RepID=UPI003908448C
MSRSVEVVPENGLHARPAATFVRTANEFSSDVTVAPDGGESVDATSMIAVTALGVGHGERVTITADGEDEAAAIDALLAVLAEPVE